jgi:hypothetical protein
MFQDPQRRYLMIKPVSPSNKYPLGGLKVIVTVWQGGKREPVLDYRLYLDKTTEKIDKRRAQDDAEILEKQLKKDLKAERDTKTVLAGNMRTFKDYATHYRAQCNTRAGESLINDMMRDFGEALPDQWPSKFEKFIEKQAGRKVLKLKWVTKTDENGKERRIRKDYVETDTEISPATLKGYRRYFKAVCGYSCKEDIPEIDRLPKNYGTAFKVGKSESRSGFPTDIQRSKAIEYIGNRYPWFLPAFQFACQMPIRPCDQFATMFPKDGKDKDFWDEFPKHLTPSLGLTIEKINEVQKSIRYLPKKTWHTEKYATPLILPNVEKYIYDRIGDEECNAIFWAPGSCYKDKDPSKRHPITTNLLRRLWDDVREHCNFDIDYYSFTRHDAVSFLRLHNIPDSAIMQYAGWSTRQVLESYDSLNTDRLKRTTYDLLAGAVSKESEHQKTSIL